MREVIERKRKIKGRCSALGCGNSVTGKTKFCGSCRCRLSRIKDPVRYSYNNKKNRAKQRKSAKFPQGIPFTISLEYFREFCFKTNYIGKCGRTAEGHDCDRIIEDLGYVEGNLQSIPKLDNIKKYHKIKRLSYDWRTRTAVVMIDGDLPLGIENEDYF